MNADNCRRIGVRASGRGVVWGSAGFSLVELVVTLGIISLLSALAVASYMGFRQRALTAEARLGLHNIWLLEKTFHKENDRYSADLNELSFHMVGHPRYTYSVQAVTNSFTARAEANLDKDAALDVWEIYSSDVTPAHRVID